MGAIFVFFSLLKSVQLFKSYWPGYGYGEQVRDFVYLKDAVSMALEDGLSDYVRYQQAGQKPLGWD